MLLTAHDSAMQIEDAFTTSFENVLVNAGADVRVTLHFGSMFDI